MPFADRPLGIIDAVAPVGVALLWITLVSALPEPARQRFNAIVVAGAGAAYLSGGLGAWEFVYCAVATLVAYRSLDRYRFLALGWTMHTGWDVVHHLWGQPIVWAVPTSSAQCAVCDLVLAGWFLAGAPSILPGRAAKTGPRG